MAGPLIASTCLLVGAMSDSALLAVAALSLSYGFQMFAEAAFWATAMDIGGRMTGSVTGVINTTNNLGGVVSTALVPILVAHFGWVPALSTCAVASAAAAALWLGVRPEESIESAS